MGANSPEAKIQRAAARRRQDARIREQQLRVDSGREFILALPPGSVVVNFGAPGLGRLRLAYGPDGEEISREETSDIRRQTSDVRPAPPGAGEPRDPGGLADRSARPASARARRRNT